MFDKAGDVTATWWRKDRDRTAVFVDYNQNARDHTMAAVYSVRGVPGARVSTPITWDEVDDVDPADLTIAIVPLRFAELGDLHAGITSRSSRSISCRIGPSAIRLRVRSM